MSRPTPEVYTAAAALVVALLKGGFLEEAEDFITWYLDTFDSDLSHLLPAELEEEI